MSIGEEDKRELVKQVAPIIRSSDPDEAAKILVRDEAPLSHPPSISSYSSNFCDFVRERNFCLVSLTSASIAEKIFLISSSVYA